MKQAFARCATILLGPLVDTTGAHLDMLTSSPDTAYLDTSLIGVQALRNSHDVRGNQEPARCATLSVVSRRHLQWRGLRGAASGNGISDGLETVIASPDRHGVPSRARIDLDLDPEEVVVTKVLLQAVLVISAAVAIAADPMSPWDKGQTEIKQGVRCPIVYPEIFTRERELFAYSPRFLPGQLTFTLDNRPVIRIGLDSVADVGRNKQTVTTRAPGDVNLIQYLDRDGRWHVTDGHLKAVTTLLSQPPDTRLKVIFGERTCDAVEFDAKGNAYTLVATDNGTFLVVSTDDLQTFQAVRVPYGNGRLEPYRFHADRSNPPPILAASGGEYALVPVTLERGTTPRLGKGVVLAKSAAKPLAQISTMAGDGAPILTSGGKTFFAYMSETPAVGLTGSPQYLLEYDHATGTVGSPLLLGTTGHQIDDHNLPVIDIDSHGHIHVIAGAHWHSFKHFVSKQPFSAADGFRELDGIGTASSNAWSRNGLSYPGFVIDAEGTLHVVARGRSQRIQASDHANEYDDRYTDVDMNYGLVYFRCPAVRTWQVRSDLVIPAWPRYGNFYHKLTIDRRGGLHAIYYYYASRLWQSPGALKAYQQHWPEENVPDDDDAADAAMKAHDPVIVSSFDGGRTWTPTTTSLFLAAVKPAAEDSSRK